MRNNSIIYKICKIMKLAGKPVNINYIFNKLDEQGIESKKKTIDVMICHNRQLFNRSKEECCDCGHLVSFYSLTDQALIGLADVERCQVPPSASEWEEFGIMVQT